jgi:hypothetical protein
MNQLVVNQPQPKKRRSVLKWILLGFGGSIILVVALLAVSGYVMYRKISRDPATAESLSQKILEFEKPSGYTGRLSMEMFGMKMAVLVSHSGGGNDRGGIILISTPKGTRQAPQLRAYLEKRGYSNGVTERLFSETFKVRGRDAPAQVAIIALKDSSSKMRKYTIDLDGGSGDSVMLVFLETETKATHDWAQEFLDSVK